MNDEITPDYVRQRLLEIQQDMVRAAAKGDEEWWNALDQSYRQGKDLLGRLEGREITQQELEDDWYGVFGE